MSKKVVRKAWGGFLDGRLDWTYPLPEHAETDWGPAAVFKTKAEALRRYEDVRRVEITIEERSP